MTDHRSSTPNISRGLVVLLLALVAGIAWVLKPSGEDVPGDQPSHLMVTRPDGTPINGGDFRVTGFAPKGASGYRVIVCSRCEGAAEEALRASTPGIVHTVSWGGSAMSMAFPEPEKGAWDRVKGFFGGGGPKGLDRHLEPEAGQLGLPECEGSPLFISSDDYRLLSENSDVSAGELVVVPYEQCHGYVVDQDGAPIDGVKVEAFFQGPSAKQRGERVQTVLSGHDGSFSIRVARHVGLELRAWRSGYSSELLSLGAAEPSALRIVLRKDRPRPKVVFSGQVRSPGQSEFPNGHMLCGTSGMLKGLSPDGSFRFEKSRFSGNEMVGVFVPGVGSSPPQKLSELATPDSDGNWSANIDLLSNDAEITIDVKSESGAPLAGCEAWLLNGLQLAGAMGFIEATFMDPGGVISERPGMTVMRASGGLIFSGVTSGVDGRLHLQNLRHGENQVRVLNKEHGYSNTFTFSAPGTYEVEVPTGELEQITGELVDRNGRSISGYTLRVNAYREGAVRSPWMTIDSVTTDASGQFQMDLPNGNDPVSIGLWDPAHPNMSNESRSVERGASHVKLVIDLKKELRVIVGPGQKGVFCVYDEDGAQLNFKYGVSISIESSSVRVPASGVDMKILVGTSARRVALWCDGSEVASFALDGFADAEGLFEARL